MPLFTSARERRLWLWTLIVMVAIYSTLGLARMLAGELRDRELAGDAFFLGMILIGVSIVVHGLRARPRGVEIGVWLGVVGAYLIAFLRMTVPEERTHLFEYTVVALLIHEALAERRSNGRRVPSPAALTVGVTALLGLLDEGIQALLPSRTFDFRDVGLNFLAGLLAMTGTVSIGWARGRVQRLGVRAGADRSTIHRSSGPAELRPAAHPGGNDEVLHPVDVRGAGRDRLRCCRRRAHHDRRDREPSLRSAGRGTPLDDLAAARLRDEWCAVSGHLSAGRPGQPSSHDRHRQHTGPARYRTVDDRGRGSQRCAHSRPDDAVDHAGPAGRAEVLHRQGRRSGSVSAVPDHGTGAARRCGLSNGSVPDPGRSLARRAVRAVLTVHAARRLRRLPRHLAVDALG